MFQLHSEEAEALRFQSGTSNKGRGGRRYLPYALLRSPSGFQGQSHYRPRVAHETRKKSSLPKGPAVRKCLL
jgi:hypothetical protein